MSQALEDDHDDIPGTLLVARPEIRGFEWRWRFVLRIDHERIITMTSNFELSLHSILQGSLISYFTPLCNYIVLPPLP